MKGLGFVFFNIFNYILLQRMEEVLFRGGTPQLKSLVRFPPKKQPS